MNHFVHESAKHWTETIPTHEHHAEWMGKATVWCTAAAALCGCFSWWFSSTVSEMKERARMHFETEHAEKMKVAESEVVKARQETAKALAETARNELMIETAEAQIAEAKKEAARAGEGTAKALAEVAVAKENTSRLEVEAANLRERAARAEKELIEVQGQIQPRRLTLEQQTRLLRAFELAPKGSIVVDTVMGDGEALMFAGQIRDILKVSGWGDVHLTRSTYTGNPIGLSILYGDKPSIAIPLADAFDSIGIKTKLSRVPQAPEDAVKILVGMKPYP